MIKCCNQLKMPYSANFFFQCLGLLIRKNRVIKWIYQYPPIIHITEPSSFSYIYRETPHRQRCECLRKGPDFFLRHVTLQASATADAAACYFAGCGERERFPQAVRLVWKRARESGRDKCIGSAAKKRDRTKATRPCLKTPLPSD